MLRVHKKRKLQSETSITFVKSMDFHHIVWNLWKTSLSLRKMNIIKNGYAPVPKWKTLEIAKKQGNLCLHAYRILVFCKMVLRRTKKQTYLLLSWRSLFLQRYMKESYSFLRLSAFDFSVAVVQDAFCVKASGKNATSKSVVLPEFSRAQKTQCAI